MGPETNIDMQQCPEEDYINHCKNHTPEIFCPREIRCPAETWTDEYMEHFLRFEELSYYWIDGVALCLLSILGILLNISGIVIISRHPSLHNVFNYLLISLFVFDSTYILTTMLNQSLMKQFNVMSR